mmetsp:Transcript_1690/g.4072  ORF Transcript_1690/g.4072 Transcript_1690/m.4072 type:complete len:489 (+) Transcript_1690:143-1609(+)
MNRATATPASSADDVSTTDRDVINGKGQGVQRLKGNADYRKAVKAHKVLYAMCAKNKVKIAKGIVKALHNRGGRFLKLDERTGVYSELGNAGKQGAVEKTSQALREKQTALMMQIRAYESSGGDIPKTQFSDEEFYQYSLHVFASIHGEPMSELPAPVKAMVEISNLEADFGARSAADHKAPLAPFNSRHTMVAARRDQRLGVEPGKSRKHRMPAAEPSTEARNQKKSRITVEPGPDDCLCGRGGRSNHHPGNVFFRKETMKYRERYEQSSKGGKYNISELVVESLKSMGVRFLRENDEGGWFEISHHDARKKVSQALREKLPKGILKKANHEAIAPLEAPPSDSDYVPLNDGTEEVLNLASSLLDLSDRGCTSSSRPPSLAKCDRISTGEYTEMMTEPLRASSESWSTVLFETGTEPILEPVNLSILGGQLPDFGSVEPDTKDQERPSKTRGQMDIAKEKKINKKLNTWAEMSSSSVSVSLARGVPV